MNVNLTDRLEEFVKAKVDSGLYNSASEVVRDALRLMAEQDQIREAKLEALRREVQIGLDELDAGKGEPLNMAEIKAEARRLFEKEQAVSEQSK
jgi:antitoxin ParD1/3/4